MTPPEIVEPPPWQAVQDEIAGLLARIDRQAFDAMRDAFGKTDRRWFFSGQGRSGLVAQMAAMRFMHLGYATHAVGEATAPAVRAGDGFLLICGSGKTPTSLAFAEIARSEGARLVVVTRAPDSTLAGMADIVLPIPAGATRQFGGSLFEQCALILLDSIALSLSGDGEDAHSAMWRRHTNLQ